MSDEYYAEYVKELVDEGWNDGVLYRLTRRSNDEPTQIYFIVDVLEREGEAYVYPADAAGHATVGAGATHATPLWITHEVVLKRMGLTR